VGCVGVLAVIRSGLRRRGVWRGHYTALSEEPLFTTATGETYLVLEAGGKNEWAETWAGWTPSPSGPSSYEADEVMEAEVEYSLEIRDWLPVLGEGVYDVLIDGDIVDVTLKIREMWYEGSEPYGTVVADCLLEGRHVYLLVGQRDLVWQLTALRYKLPKVVHIWEEPKTGLLKMEVIK